ncbi:11994_t:CDS:1 [Racocetra fulgida]|uniref:11994_t:CDS:1 n=1 Tax=Racocetra fulgida TaxID=60492 RepID=A0A9N9IWC3_9GLOM|nr:11994_t:CDS:1 [Racocetra fulgida]
MIKSLKLIKKKYNLIKNGIIKEKDSIRLEVNWKDTIDNAKYLNNNQKTKLHRLRNSQKWEIQGSKKFEQYKSEIENKVIISNLLDRKSYNILISNDSLLTEQQKNQLYTLRKQRIQILTNSLFDKLKNNIKNKRVLSKLEDKGYYDNRINEIHKEFLTDRKTKDLHILRRWKLDKIQSETEDELYDVNSELIDTIQDLNELGDNSDLANDILELNQTLLTGDRNINDLITKRKQNYNNKLYDNFIAAIKIKTDIEELQNNWKIKIDTEIKKEFLLQFRTIKNLHKI